LRGPAGRDTGLDRGLGLLVLEFDVAIQGGQPAVVAEQEQGTGQRWQHLFVGMLLVAGLGQFDGGASRVACVEHRLAQEKPCRHALRIGLQGGLELHDRSLVVVLVGKCLGRRDQRLRGLPLAT
jgi:hypothetical protein